MTSPVPPRDGLRPPALDDTPPARDESHDAVPRGCLCRDDLMGTCPADLSTCEDVPVMFFS